MKKIIFIALFTSLYLTSFGQIQFGLAGGVNVGTLSTDLDHYKRAAELGLKAGAFVRMGRKLYLQPELFYSTRSAGITYNLDHVSGTARINQFFTFKSIDIPVMIGYKIFNPPHIHVRLNAGPVASFVTKKQFDIMVDDVKTTPDREFKQSFRNVITGLQFGAGLDVLFLTVDVRYEMGLNNIYKKGMSAPTSDYNELKTNLFFVCLGFKLFRI